MIEEIAAAVKESEEVVQLGLQMIQAARNENRDPTPEELAAFHTKRKASEDRWASLAPKAAQ